MRGLMTLALVGLVGCEDVVETGRAITATEVSVYSSGDSIPMRGGVPVIMHCGMQDGAKYCESCDWMSVSLTLVPQCTLQLDDSTYTVAWLE
jgi:hypothetical protein